MAQVVEILPSWRQEPILHSVNTTAVDDPGAARIHRSRGILMYEISSHGVGTGSLGIFLLQHPRVNGNAQCQNMNLCRYMVAVCLWKFNKLGSVYTSINHKMIWRNFLAMSHADSAKLVSPWSSTDEKVGGPVKNMGGPIKLLYI